MRCVVKKLRTNYSKNTFLNEAIDYESNACVVYYTVYIAQGGKSSNKCYDQKISILDFDC